MIYLIRISNSGSVLNQLMIVVVTDKQNTNIVSSNVSKRVRFS